MRETLQGNPDTVILKSDDARLHLSGSVNKQNCCCRSNNNAEHCAAHCDRVTVCTRVAKFRATVTYILEAVWRPMTVNSPTVLRGFPVPEIRCRRANGSARVILTRRNDNFGRVHGRTKAVGKSDVPRKRRWSAATVFWSWAMWLTLVWSYFTRKAYMIEPFDMNELSHRAWNSRVTRCNVLEEWWPSVRRG